MMMFTKDASTVTTLDEFIEAADNPSFSKYITIPKSLAMVIVDMLLNRIEFQSAEDISEPVSASSSKYIPKLNDLIHGDDCND